MRIVSDKSLNFSWLPCMKHWQSVTVFKMKCSAWVRKMGECGSLLLCSYVSCEHYWYAFINNNVFFYVLFLNLSISSITWTIESLKKCLHTKRQASDNNTLFVHTHTHTCTQSYMHSHTHTAWSMSPALTKGDNRPGYLHDLGAFCVCKFSAY